MSEFEQRRARISAGEIAYVEEGDPENPAVVFLHGFPTSSFLWREFLPLFAPWMHVIAPDLLGCGDSQKPDGPALHIRAQAGYVRELLGGLGIERFAAVGHGLGGGIAQLFALEGGVDAMVLVGSVGFEAWPSDSTKELQRRSFTDGGERLAAEVLDGYLRASIAHAERLTGQVREAYLRPFSGAEGARAFFRGLRAADGLGLAGREEELGRLSCPTLILWGEDDSYSRVDVAERLSDAIPTSSLALLPGCSHLLPEDAPETIAPLMFDYLRSQYLGRPHSHEEPGKVIIQLERKPPGGQG